MLFGKIIRSNFYKRTKCSAKPNNPCCIVKPCFYHYIPTLLQKHKFLGILPYLYAHMRNFLLLLIGSALLLSDAQAWDYRQHGGIDFEKSGFPNRVTLVRQNAIIDPLLEILEEPVSGKIRDQKVPIATGPDRGTYYWLFPYVGQKFAQEVAACNVEVDEGLTDPVKNALKKDRKDRKMASSRHFNISKDKNAYDGTALDSRISLIRSYMKIACSRVDPQDPDVTALEKELKTIYPNETQITPQRALGGAMHLGGDLFAHCGPFAHLFHAKVSCPCYRIPSFYAHIADPDIIMNPRKTLNLLDFDMNAISFADNPYYINPQHGSPLSWVPEDRKFGLNQRYTDTGTGTLLLLYIFLKESFPEITEVTQPLNTIIAARIHDSLYHPNITPYPGEVLDPKLRGTHALLGIINEFREDPTFSAVFDDLNTFAAPLEAFYGPNTEGLSAIVKRRPSDPVQITLLPEHRAYSGQALRNV